MAENKVDFDIKSYLPVLATVYGEVANGDREDKIHLISSIFNRAESGKAEFGADTGRITDVLNKGYYAYSTKSKKFMEAFNQKFPDKASKDSFNEIIYLTSGILNGSVPRYGTLFNLKADEIAQQKDMFKKSGGKRGMNMSLLEKTGETNRHIYMKYKEASKVVKKSASSSKEMDFGQAYSSARKQGLKEFTFKGKKYSTEMK